jgi:Highly conserved protein containing a thioredoxin domain
MCRLPIIVLLLFSFFALHAQKAFDVKRTSAIVEEQLRYRLKTFTDTNTFPRSVKDGQMVAVPSRDWTSGFYAGVLWQMYELTRDETWARAARKWTESLEREQFNTRTHDLGFMLYCSYGNGLRLAPSRAYEEVLMQGARSLSTRFRKTTGTIKSWDHGDWEFPVIIDNMMNLELLFWATKVSGDSSFYNIAVTHALTTMKNHFRSDYSSYHVVDYDTVTGKVKQRVTHQGHADESAWARGQAWALYGYTMTYRETKDKRFLEQAIRIADFMLSHPNLPKDKVPYWDYNAPGIPNEERDASAAAILASALLELQQYVDSGKRYKDAATFILASLASPEYLATPGSNQGFLLLHSTGHKPHKSEIDVPLIYADYYFLEALIRYRKLLQTEK